MLDSTALDLERITLPNIRRLKTQVPAVIYKDDHKLFCHQINYN